MAAKAPKKAAEPPLARTLGANVYRLRVMLLPRPGQDALAEMADVSPETVRQIEDSRDPKKVAKNTSLETVEKLAAGFRKLGVKVEALDLLKYQATPSKPTGRRDHLRVVRGTGDALPDLG